MIIRLGLEDKLILVITITRGGIMVILAWGP
jgi:hypothetical protein